MFIDWPAAPYVRHIEGRGHSLRQRLKLGVNDALDPWRLMTTFDSMHLLDLRKLPLSSAGDLSVARMFKGSWSALAYREGDGPWLITWNPWHAGTRIRVSLMEEVSHIILGHKPTTMTPDPTTGLPRRTYSRSKEKEAYGVAGAALVPYNGLVIQLRSGANVADIAESFGVSESLVQMRLNVTRAIEVVQRAS